MSAAKTLNDIQVAWRLAPDTVLLLCQQLKSTGAALAQIQRQLLEDTDALADKSDVHPAVDTALTACLVSSIWLKRFMQKITQGVHIIDGLSRPIRRSRLALAVARAVNRFMNVRRSLLSRTLPNITETCLAVAGCEARTIHGAPARLGCV